jgi:predicted phage tail protein
LRRVKIVLHGVLATMYEGLTIAAETASDAIEGWARQVGMADVPLAERPVIDVMGCPTKDDLKAPLEVDELHLVPAMFGGGGKFGRILIGAAMIAISFLPFVGPAMHAALIISGAMSVLSGVASFFMKSPSLSKEDDPAPSKYIGTGKNTTGIGTIIGMGGGRMLVGGQFLSLQVNSSDLVYGSFPSNVPA